MVALPRNEILGLFVAVMAGITVGNYVGNLYGSSVLAVIASAAVIVVVGTAGERLLRRLRRPPAP
jgi:3-hydroxy-3-methylglutaryl CoA synthase